jgi:hypothetical protein
MKGGFLAEKPPFQAEKVTFLAKKPPFQAEKVTFQLKSPIDRSSDTDSIFRLYRRHNRPIQTSKLKKAIRSKSRSFKLYDTIGRYNNRNLNKKIGSAD